MKISLEERARMATMLSGYDTEDRRQAYREGRFPRADAVKDLDKRYRWDLFYYVGMANEMRFGRDVYDSHIYTVLSRLVPSLSEGK
jgi:hypothetical protein